MSSELSAPWAACPCWQGSGILPREAWPSPLLDCELLKDWALGYEWSNLQCSTQLDWADASWGAPGCPLPRVLGQEGGWFLPRIRKVCSTEGELLYKVVSVSSLEVIK